MMAVGFVAGPFLLWFSYDALFGQHLNGRLALDMVFGVLALAMGLVMPIGAFLFFRKEVKHWRLKKMTADRVVAGGMLTGIGLAWIAFEYGSQSYGAHGEGLGLLAMFLLGGAIFALFLAVGLVYAFWPKPTRTWRNVAIVTRYALDDKLLEIPDASGPFEDGWVPVVIVKTSRGEQRKMPASETAYEMAYRGAVGTAWVRERKLVRFTPRLKDPSLGGRAG
ncbi:MAG: hypothetical protein QOJ65_1663 [Fimbriimonadaceae bacterium]|nr:hypothetical protein [Fimbriimonadaceae bacterium]